jgi:hypothetical protein
MSKTHFIIKKILPPIIFVFLLFIGCDRIHDIFSSSDNKFNNVKQEGLFIYPTKVEYTSDLSHQNFNIDSVYIGDDPIIFYNDIISYDTTSHILNLTYSRDSLKSKIGEIGIYGKSFLITLDSSKIYGGFFWAPYSSISCHWVVIEPDCLFDSLKTNEIRIKLGYPNENHFKGEDPRNNTEIFDRLIEDGKVKEN